MGVAGGGPGVVMTLKAISSLRGVLLRKSDGCRHDTSYCDIRVCALIKSKEHALTKYEYDSLVNKEISATIMYNQGMQYKWIAMTNTTD